jgi:uncharacterized protein (TIGR02569 family)
MSQNNPPRAIAQRFGYSVEPVLIARGQRTTYRAGDIVLKPSTSPGHEEWVAGIFSSLPHSSDVRFARPVRSIDGRWVESGFVAWTFLEGEHRLARYGDKLRASDAYHGLLQGIARPDFLISPSSSWAAADRVVWQERPFGYDREFMVLIDQIAPHLRPMNVPGQPIHGDLSGNFLMHDSLPPAIIDFSPAWAPRGFAEGIMLADAITWERAERRALDAFFAFPNIDQFAWRGIFRRIAEQAEHIAWFGKDRGEAIAEARSFQKAIDVLESRDRALR